jgi:hypothetical protein
MRSSSTIWLAALVGLGSRSAVAADADGGSGGAPPAQARRADRFGVQEIYPSAPGGREWSLPDNPAGLDSQWMPESKAISAVAPGVYRTQGQVRINIVSPEGAAWWRDVEMTAYFREVGPVADKAQTPHWELFARGERHSHGPVKRTQVNQGHRPPPGTETWPGYPFGDVPIPPECLGTAYHGNFYPDGRAHFEKEISHTGGYGSVRRGETRLTGFEDPVGRWFGLKFVAYNRSPQNVHLELWADATGDGRWRMISQTDDSGGWQARDPNLDGCGAAPFGYQLDQILSWRGPWVTFRADALAFDFKRLSVREIVPSK